MFASFHTCDKMRAVGLTMDTTQALAKLKALVNTSLYYNKDVYDRERLGEMKEILFDISQKLTSYSEAELEAFFNEDLGYVTPKVDIRAVVFEDDRKNAKKRSVQLKGMLLIFQYKLLKNSSVNLWIHKHNQNLLTAILLSLENRGLVENDNSQFSKIQ